MASGVSILDRVIEPQAGGFSNEHAQYVLSLDFSPEQQTRYAELSDKVQNGTLSEQDEAELDEFIAANALLTILQSKTRMSLKRHSRVA